MSTEADHREPLVLKRRERLFSDSSLSIPRRVANLRGTARCILLLAAGAVESKACVHLLAVIKSNKVELPQGIGNMMNT